MLIRCKQGFTGGAGVGSWTGWTDWWSSQHNAGIPVNVCLVDSAGQIYEIQQDDLDEDVLIYRTSIELNGFNPNTPDYNKNPADEASRMLSYKYVNLWPPELNRHKVWLKDTNEIRTRNNPGDTSYQNMSVSEYWGRYGIASINYAIQNNVKIVLFSPSSGDHDSEFWSHPKMLECLALAALHRDRIIIGLHEYSYVPDNLFALVGNDSATYQDVLDADKANIWKRKVGRFKLLFDVCDENMVDWPTIYFPEWGWSYGSQPATNEAVRQIELATEHIYGAYYKYIAGFATWYLTKWQGTQIDIQTNKLLQPLAQLAINKQFDVEEKKPKLEGNMATCTIPKRKRVSIWIPPFDQLDSTQLQQVIIWAEGGFPDNNNVMTNGEHMLCPSHEDAIAIHDAGTDDSILAVAYPNQIGSGVNDQWFLNNYPCVFNGNKQVVYLPKEQTSNPLTGLQLGHLFQYQYAYAYAGGRFNDPREYGNGKHEGVDADVIGGSVNNKVNVLCTYDGVVDISIDSTGGYGKYVRVKHTRNGSEFYTRYTHLDTRIVQAGMVVTKGTAIGEVGSTGNVTGEHVHMNLEVPNYGLRGYVVDWVVDPAPYLPKNNSSLPPVPSGTTRPKFGLHLRADPTDISTAEKNEQTILMSAGGGSVKALHNHPQSVFHFIGQLVPKPSIVIVRVIEQFNGRVVTPQNFFDWTRDDLQTKLNILAQYNITPIVELHNEPNLVEEGLTQSWADGTQFGNWLKQVVQLFKQRWPNLNYIYPGLSPGGTLANVRQDSTQFLQQSINTGVFDLLDGCGVHAYWSSAYPVSGAINHVNLTKSMTGEKAYVTECSINDRPAVWSASEYGRQYAQFIKSVAVESISFFVGSASNQYFAPECWVSETGVSKGIATALITNL